MPSSPSRPTKAHLARVARLEAGDEEPTEITFVFGSHDGRYVEADRPVVEAGRLPTGPAEVALERAGGDRHGVRDRRRRATRVLGFGGRPRSARRR